MQMLFYTLDVSQKYPRHAAAVRGTDGAVAQVAGTRRDVQAVFKRFTRGQLQMDSHQFSKFCADARLYGPGSAVCSRRAGVVWTVSASRRRVARSGFARCTGAAGRLRFLFC